MALKDWYYGPDGPENGPEDKPEDGLNTTGMTVMTGMTGQTG
jgi:hypothetical protein